jgi:thiol-disulfide isomerase/thioredoxin
MSAVSVESITAFVEDFKAGKLRPHLKSEPNPENNNGPVKILTGNNWDEIVGDVTKDVFVKYYAPWCGHCKTLAPIWEELGADVPADLVIAHMDSTANEVASVKV